jgi:mRNA interferase RelE/StbE
MWTVHLDAKAEKDLKRLDRQTRSLILSYLQKRLQNCKDPRAFGKGLSGPLSKYSISTLFPYWPANGA